MEIALSLSKTDRTSSVGGGLSLAFTEGDPTFKISIDTASVLSEFFYVWGKDEAGNWDVSE